MSSSLDRDLLNTLRRRHYNQYPDVIPASLQARRSRQERTNSGEAAGFHDNNAVMCTFLIDRKRYPKAYANALELREMQGGVDLDSLHEHAYPNPGDTQDPRAISNGGVWAC